MRILVCGSRHFVNYAEMREVLCTMFDRDDTITLIHGDAKGADKMSEQVLTGFFKGGFTVERYPADWKKHGKAAGPIRNKQMLDEGKPDLVIAFMAENSRGTKNMVDQATRSGVPVKVINI